MITSFDVDNQRINQGILNELKKLNKLIGELNETIKEVKDGRESGN